MAILANQDPLADWDNLPLSHARIGYDQRILNPITGSPVFVNLPLTPNTYERVRPSGGAVYTYETAGSVSLDYFAIGAHSLGSASRTVTIEVRENGALEDDWILVDELSPKDDQAIMLLTETYTNIENVRFSLDSGTGPTSVGVLMAGIALQMYQPIFGGHSPQDLSASTIYQGNISESGNFLDRNIIRQGTETNLSFSNLRADWYRERFQPFVEYAKRRPFFIKWRPDLYETATYSHTTSDIVPTNEGGAKQRMSVSMSIRGHV